MDTATADENGREMAAAGALARPCKVGVPHADVRCAHKAALKRSQSAVGYGCECID